MSSALAFFIITYPVKLPQADFSPEMISGYPVIRQKSIASPVVSVKA